jgi:hypothetical protein
MTLADSLVGWAKRDQDLQHTIDERTTTRGGTAQSVEIRDGVFLGDLDNALRGEAHSQWERRARVILGESEKQIVQSCAEVHRDIATMPRLRAMTMWS